MRILIAGGGLGGLTAAVALLRKGFRVSVFEKSDELREIGAGLGVWPNATRVLRELGVLETNPRAVPAPLSSFVSLAGSASWGS